MTDHKRMKVTAVFMVVFGAYIVSALAPQRASAAREPIDRIIAVVEDEAIFSSDVDDVVRQILFQTRNASPTEAQLQELRREALGVLLGLDLHAGQGVPGLLGLQGTDGLAVHEQQVVGEAVAGGHGELADGYAEARREVHLVAVLHDPAGCFEGSVDVHAGIAF